MTDTTTNEATVPATVPSSVPATQERTDKDVILAVAKAIHRVKDPDIKVADGHPWMSDATWFVAALDAYFADGKPHQKPKNGASA